MRSWLRRTFLGTLALTVVPLQGCSLGWVTVAIPDFSSKSVDGVWLWHLSPATGLYERDTRFVFGAPLPESSGEWIDYQVAPANGSPAIPASAQITRNPANPDQVTLTLLFPREDVPGSYRASTYNEAGDSPLSSEAMPL